MPSIAENLQTLINIKNGLKEALNRQGKAPTNAMGSYAGLIDGLENPERVVYTVTLDGENEVFAQLHGEEKVQLTATPNDIREGSVAITETGVITGEKFIPSYISRYGKKYVLANSEAVITGAATDYKQIMISIAPFDSSLDASVGINYVSVDDSVYDVNTGLKVASITKDVANDRVNLGVIATEKSVLRYFLVEEEV
jgi:hypothetical protein